MASSLRKVLFLDCDGVLLDWTGPFLKFVKAPITKEDIQDYQMTKTGLWLDTDAFMTDLVAFEKTNEWQDLPPLCLCTDLEVLKNIGFELRVLTMAGTTPVARANRVQNLTRRFGGVFDGIHFVSPTDCKLEWLEEWHTIQRVQSSGVSIIAGLVEDKPSTLRKAVEWGVRAFGIRQTYNREAWDYEGIEWSPGVQSLAYRLSIEETA